MSEQGDALNRMAREAGLPVKGLRLVEQGGGAGDDGVVELTEENMRKILDTETLAAAPYIVFDDINGFFKSGILNSFLTAPTWSGCARRRCHE